MERQEIVINIPQIPLEEQEKYRGKHVAIVDGKVVAAGYSSLEAYRKAQELFPEKGSERIMLAYIPREEVLIL